MANKHSDDGVFALLLGMILGVLGGTLAGFLYAPKPGKAFRKDVKTWVQNLPELIEDEMEPDSRSRKFIERTRHNLENQVENLGKTRQATRMAQAKQREQYASGIDY